MTRLWNDPADFADEMIAGFVAANGRYVRRVPGGVVRSTGSPDGQVAVVIGGGSGHYPAFAGLVGAGLAHGAAMGNLFASPSTQQIVSVAKAAHQGGGVFFTYGNYAGDVLNFDAAERRLAAEGIPAATVTVTDDVASASPAEREKRRGIAGDLTVFRAAAAAAERGADLAEVTRIATKADDRTRSFGVAFSGCTLPGADHPLFTVPEGRMAIGLGIHGEPGVDETDIPTADGLATMLVERLLAERPDDADGRVVPILNGLGSLKYEEMFVVYRRIAELLEQAGLTIVDPHVGEYCTSFDMAGTSLTLYWLDDELAELWEHPVDTPAYRRGSVASPARTDAEASASPVSGAATSRTPSGAAAPSGSYIPDDTSPSVEIPPADDESRAVGGTVLLVLEAIAATVDEHVDELGRMDSVAGDGDHGIGMQRGSRAALGAGAAAHDQRAGAGTVLVRAADAWSDRAGGTSGALWGLILTAVAARLGDTGRPTASDIAEGIAAGADDVMQYGGAEIGDKTLVDALVPFATILRERIDAGESLAAAWRDAAQDATAAAAGTADLVPKRGRARTHGDHSVGTPDPGAHSLALIVTAVGRVLADASNARDAEGATDA